MITREEAAKRFEEEETIVCTPTDRKRVCVVAFGFVGAKEEEYKDWSGASVKGVGFKFFNDGDKSEQLLASSNGVFLCYEDKMPDGRMRSEAIKEYLETHPLAVKTIGGVEGLMKFMKTVALNADGVPDVYTSHTGFVAGKIVGAPALEDIKPGQVIVGQKVGERVQAFFVEPGTQFEGAEETTTSEEGQTATARGAYILKDSVGMRLIQADEFAKSYRVISEPKAKGKATPDKGIEM